MISSTPKTHFLCSHSIHTPSDKRNVRGHFRNYTYFRGNRAIKSEKIEAEIHPDNLHIFAEIPNKPRMRLIFEEKRISGTNVNVVGVTVGELLAKMINELSILSKKPQNRELRDSFRTLEQHNTIYKIGYSYDDMECQIKALPSIILAVPNDRCKAICDILQAALMGETRSSYFNRAAGKNPSAHSEATLSALSVRTFQAESKRCVRARISVLMLCGKACFVCSALQG